MRKIKGVYLVAQGFLVAKFDVRIFANLPQVEARKIQYLFGFPITLETFINHTVLF